MKRREAYGFTRTDDVGQGVWDGKWHNASGTYDGTTVRLFIGDEVSIWKKALPIAEILKKAAILLQPH